MPGGGGALAAVHSGQGQAAAGQHDGSALLQPGLTCTGRTETLLSSGARHRVWANFDRRHSSPRARSDKMLTVRKLRLVERKRLPCEPATGWLGVDSRRRLFAEEPWGDDGPPGATGVLSGGGLGCTRLSLHFRATFLSPFRTTTPQISQNFRESSSHKTRWGSKGQVLSMSFWRGLHFSAFSRQNPIFVAWARLTSTCSGAIFQGIGLF